MHGHPDSLNIAREREREKRQENRIILVIYARKRISMKVSANGSRCKWRLQTPERAVNFPQY